MVAGRLYWPDQDAYPDWLVDMVHARSAEGWDGDTLMAVAGGAYSVSLRETEWPGLVTPVVEPQKGGER